MARKTSTRRVIAVSVQLPKKPAMAPSVTPMSSEMTVARIPMRRDTRAPKTTRL
jgi:hypothetical protein